MQEIVKKTEGTPLPTPERVTRDDGVVWREYMLREDGRVVGVVVLTHAGAELLRSRGVSESIMPALKRYRDAVKAGAENSDRRIFAVSSNSTVFAVGDTEIIVKEAKHTQAVYYATGVGA